ncbi:MAG: hypothetical protein ACEPOZ_19935 [Marinifilaceae bacterium]
MLLYVLVGIPSAIKLLKGQFYLNRLLELEGLSVKIKLLVEEYFNGTGKRTSKKALLYV